MSVRSISVVIPTHNRCESVINVLESVEGADSEGVDLEVVVVASNCADDTVRICNAYSRNVSFRMCVKDVQVPGVARAKNVGMDAAGGELILFIDDDMTVSEDIFQRYRDGMEKFPDAVIYGGRIVCCWSNGRPWWYPAVEGRRVDGVIGTFDPFVSNRYMVQTPFGGNMGMKASVLKGRYFNEKMGMRGGSVGFGEEGHLVKTLQMEGHKVAYIRDAVTYHRLQPYFYRMYYVIRRLYALNVSLIELGYKTASGIYESRAQRYLCNGVELVKAIARSVKERDTRAMFIFVEHVARENAASYLHGADLRRKKGKEGGGRASV